MNIRNSAKTLWHKLPGKQALAKAWRSTEKKIAALIDKTPRWLLALAYVAVSVASVIGVGVLDKNMRHSRLENGGRKAHLLADRKPDDVYLRLSESVATVKSWDQRPYFPPNEFQASMKGFFDLAAKRACNGVTDFDSGDYSGPLPPGERPDRCGPLPLDTARDLAVLAKQKPMNQDVFWRLDENTVVRETPITSTYSFFSDFDYARRRVCSGTLAPNRSPMRISVLPVSVTASYRPFACSSFDDFDEEGKKYIDAVKTRPEMPQQTQTVEKKPEKKSFGRAKNKREHDIS